MLASAAWTVDLHDSKKINWVPCILHGLHNVSKYRFGLVHEDISGFETTLFRKFSRSL
jgi:hypothetical protein